MDWTYSYASPLKRGSEKSGADGGGLLYGIDR